MYRNSKSAAQSIPVPKNHNPPFKQPSMNSSSTAKNSAGPNNNNENSKQSNRLPAFGEDDQFSRDEAFEHEQRMNEQRIAEASEKGISDRERSTERKVDDAQEVQRKTGLLAEKERDKKGKEVLKSVPPVKTQNFYAEPTISKKKEQTTWEGKKCGSDQVTRKKYSSKKKAKVEESSDDETEDVPDENGKRKVKAAIIKKPTKSKFKPKDIIFSDDERDLVDELKKESSNQVIKGKKVGKGKKEKLEIPSNSDDDQSMANSAISVEDLETDEDEYANLLAEEKARVAEGGTPDPLLAPIDYVDPSIRLCPFCSNPLPKFLSDRGESSLKYLLASPGIVKNPTLANPGGMKLSLTATAGFCKLHHEERVTIPDGIKAGYPTKINFAGLSKRIEGFRLRLTNIIVDTVTSDFLGIALEDAQNSNGGLLAEMGSFSVEEPGYYGLLGYEIIYNTLKAMFLDKADPFLTLEHTESLPLDFYLRRVLVPETSIFLIAEDFNISETEAAQVRIESSAFGKAFYINTEADLEELESEYVKEQKRIDKLNGKGKKEKVPKKSKKGEEIGQTTLKFTATPTVPTRKSTRKSDSSIGGSQIILSSSPVVQRRVPKKIRELEEAKKKQQLEVKEKGKPKSRLRKKLEIDSSD